MGRASGTSVVAPRAPLARRRAPAGSLDLDQLRTAKLAALGLTDAHMHQAAQIFVRDLSDVDPAVQREAAREILKLTGAYPSKSSGPRGEEGERKLVVNLALFAQPQHPGDTLDPGQGTQVHVIPVGSGSTA